MKGLVHERPTVPVPFQLYHGDVCRSFSPFLSYYVNYFPQTLMVYRLFVTFSTTAYDGFELYFCLAPGVLNPSPASLYRSYDV